MNKLIIRNMFFTITITVFLVGCSKQVAVSGKVSYKDGSPVQIGQVVFSDGKYDFRGQIDKEGNYKLGGNYEGDGILPGQYSVFLIDTIEIVMDDKGDTKQIRLVSDKYTAPETSEITCEVKGKMVFDFTVERP